METNCYDGAYAHDNPQKKPPTWRGTHRADGGHDKWTIFVIDAPGTHGETRFSRDRS
jgi:hypothetical protein